MPQENPALYFKNIPYLKDEHCHALEYVIFLTRNGMSELHQEEYQLAPIYFSDPEKYEGKIGKNILTTTVTNKNQQCLRCSQTLEAEVKRLDAKWNM